MTHKEYIEQFILEGDLSTAISEFLEGVKAHDLSRLTTNLTLQSAANHSNEQEMLLGTRSSRNYKMTKARIARALIAYLKKYNPIMNYTTTGMRAEINPEENTESTPNPSKPTSNNTPVIFTAFANKSGNYLKRLKDEDKSITNSLQKLDSDGLINHVNRSHTDIDAFFDVTDGYAGRIRIFHYAGHASPDFLELDGQKAAMDGLVEQLGKEHQNGTIYLVFLNGCSTHKHVERLLAFGIKGVIATSASINDGLATEFANRFYEVLSARNKSIVEAYKSASNYIKTKSARRKVDSLGEVKRFSSFIGSSKNARTTALPWSLYVETEGELENITLNSFIDQGVANTSINTIPTNKNQSIMPNLPSKNDLFDLIDESEFNEVFRLLKVHKSTFKGYQDLRDYYQYDNPNGRDLVQFRERLKVFIGSKY